MNDVQVPHARIRALLKGAVSECLRNGFVHLGLPLALHHKNLNISPYKVHQGIRQVIILTVRTG